MIPPDREAHYSEFGAGKVPDIEFKIVTTPGHPSQVLTAFLNGTVVPCTCTPTGSDFALAFNPGAQGEIKGLWSADMLSLTEGEKGEMSVHTSTINDEHVLNAIRDLPNRMLGNLMYSIARQVYALSDNPAYIDFFKSDEPPMWFLSQIGVTDESSQEELLVILKKMTLIHNAHANWTNAEDTPDHTTKIQEAIFSNLRDLPDIKYVTPQIVREFVNWEIVSTGAYKRKLEYEVKLKNEKKCFLNGDRIMWLLVQQKHAVLSRFPKEVVRNVALFLPRTCHSSLIFWAHTYKDFGCAGSKSYNAFITLDPQTQKADIWCGQTSKPPTTCKSKYTVVGTQINFLGDVGDIIPSSVQLEKDVSRGIFMKDQKQRIFWQCTQEEKEARMKNYQ